jgi:hypothetical protein
MTPSRFVVPAALAGWLLGGTGCSVLLQTDAQQCTDVLLVPRLA